MPTLARAPAPVPAEAASVRPSGRATLNVDETAFTDFFADLPVHDPAVMRAASSLSVAWARKRAAEESPDEGGSSKKKKRKPGKSCRNPKGPHKDPKDPPKGLRGPVV